MKKTILPSILAIAFWLLAFTSNLLALNNPEPGCNNTMDYCQSYSNFPWEDWIAKVELADLAYSSGKSVYSDFTAQSANVSAGQSYPVALTTGFSYFTWDEYWRVWIDLNHDFDFDDAGEMVFEGVKTKPANGTPTAVLNGNLSIPATALAGTTRMRVTMKRGAYATPCEIIPFGEIEDYTVNIQSGPVQLPNLVIPTFELIQNADGFLSCYTNTGERFASFGGVLLNAGTAAVGPYNMKVYISKDEQPSANDFVLEDLNYPVLAPNTSDGFIVDNIIPTSIAPGKYFVLMLVDPNNTVQESNENDNLKTVGVQLGSPDFMVNTVSGLPSTVTAGSNFNCSVTAKNLRSFPMGELTGGLKVSVYLSTDNQLATYQDVELASSTISFTDFSNPPQYLNGTATVNLAGAIPTGTNPGNYYLLVGLSETCEPPNNNVYASPIQVTGVTPGTYCQPYSNFPWEDWIAGVRIGTQEKTSGKSPYSDFTQTFNFNLFETNQVTLTAGFSYFHYDEYWRIWIDFNQDRDFDDPGELAFSGIMPKGQDGTPVQSLQASIQVPGTATPGTTRLRVMMKRGAYGAPCEVIPFGEIEDYAVNISVQGTCKKDLGPGQLACFEEAPVPGQYYVYAVDQGMRTRYTVNTNGDILGQSVTPFPPQDSILVQNNLVVKKLGNGTIAWQKPIGASVLNQFPNIEAAVELDDGSFVLSGFQRYFNGNVITDDSLVIIKTNASLDFLSYLTIHRHPGFPYIPASNKLYGLIKTQTGDVVAVYSLSISLGIAPSTSIIFSKYTPQIQPVSIFSIYGYLSSISQRWPCGNYSVNYAYSYQSIKSGLTGTATASVDLENMTVQTTRSSESGSVAYSGSFHNESYVSHLFGDTVTATYSIWISQQTVNPFTVSLKRPDGSTFYKRPPMQADYSHIIQTGDTTILMLGVTGGQVWTYNPDCSSPGAVQPDITMGNLTVQNPNTSPGAVVWFNFDLKNIGNTTATGDYILAAYLSSDNVLSNDDRVAGYINTGNTPVGTIPGVLGGITVPAEQSTGNYYLILRADVSNVILELNEINNTLVASMPVFIAPGTPEFCGFETTVANEGFSTFRAASLNGSHVFKMSKYDAGADLTTFRYQTLDDNGNTTSIEDFTLDDRPVLLADDNFLRTVNGGANLFFLKKINKAGTVLWVKQLTVPGANNLGEVSIGEAVNGDILLTGVYSIVQTSTITQNRVWYIRLDYNGRILSQNNFVHFVNNEPNLSARIFQGYNKGAYIIVEKPTSIFPFKQPRLIKISPLTGNVEWTKDFGLFVQIRGIAEMPDGALLVTTFFPSPDGGGVNTYATLHKINPAGNEIFQKSLTELAPVIPPSAQIGPPSEVSPIMRGTDGGYITGFTRILLGSISLPSQSVIIRLDGNLDTLWTRVYSSPDHGLFKTFRAVPGGAFLGTRELWNDPQVKLIKIGADGQITPCSAPGNYCDSQSDAPWHDWIARVKLNTLDNQSAKSVYSEFTNLSTTLQKGQSYPITLTTGFSWETFNEYWRVWIDWNQDGVFSSPDELVQQQILTAPANGTQTASISGSVNVPQGALTGTTQMRVSMKRGAYATACEHFTSGEVEDYTIVVVSGLTGEGGDRASNFTFEAVGRMTSVELFGAYHEPGGVAEVVFEKSTDGELYQPLDALPGGFTEAVDAVDDSPAEGPNFYRMLLYLVNGEVVVSPVRVISFEPVPDFTVFPNPANDLVHLNLKSVLGKPATIRLMDARGILIKTMVIDEVETPVFDLPLEVPSGLYFIRVEIPGRRTVGKILAVGNGF